jgi:diguanylate cyclase (GGDEF)-like protein
LKALTQSVEEERDLAGRLAGVLFLSAGVIALVLLLVPGVENDHRGPVVALAAVSLAWGLFCVTLAKPERHGPWFWHTPAVGSLLFVGGVVASTGGADSPARFYLFFVLVYTTYFYGRHEALPYVLGCVAVALVPLLYDGDAVSEGYIGEVIVVCPTYVILGLLIIKGKELLVSLRERAEELALLDPLTELHNRRAMIDWLRGEMEKGSATGLILVDLDGFKDVNTVYGYPAGDAILCETAERLIGAVGPDDVVARLGGDEFFVMLEEVQDEAAIENVIRKLLNEVLRPYDLPGGAQARLSASMGVSVFPDNADDAAALIKNADMAMYSAKQAGKNGYRFHAAPGAAPVAAPAKSGTVRAVSRATGSPLSRAAPASPEGD